MVKSKYDIIQIGFIPPPFGGVSVHIKRLNEKLSIDNYLVGGYYTDENISSIRKSNMYYKWRWLSTAKYLRLIIRFLNQIAPFRIIHSHSNLDDMLYLWTCMKLYGKKIVVTVHNSMIYDNYQRSNNFINNFFLKLMAKSDVQWIAVSQMTKDQMLQLPFNFKNKINVIPAYIPEGNCTNTFLIDPIKEFITSHDKIIVFYAHSFMLYNDIDVYGFKEVLAMYKELITIIKEKTGLIYIITEINDCGKIDDVKNFAAQLQVDNLVFWQMGPIDSMQQLWKNVDVYVRPTYTDGDSVAIREALGEGCRVVASNVCWRPDGVITYDYGNPTDFVEKVCEALAVGRGNTDYDITSYEHLLDIYNKLLEQT